MRYRGLFLLLSGVFSVTVFAQTQFPAHCSPVDFKFSQNNAVLIAKKITSRVYAITNVGKDPVWINHQKQNPGAGAGFASQLYPDHWSALLVNSKNFSMDCHVQQSNGMAVVPCEKVLKLCEFEDIHTSKSGEFWVVENVPQSQLMQHITARGF